MSVEILHESSSSLQSAGKSRWKAVLITPGKGSSGTYSEEMLRQYGPSAFPKNTHSYVDHPRDGESRNPKNLFGVLTESAHYEDGVGLVATLQIMDHWADFAAEVAPYTGLSIYAAAERTQTAEGYVVEKILPAIDNSVDLVAFAGRGGQMAERLYESAIKAPMEKPLSAQILAQIEEQVAKRFAKALAEDAGDDESAADLAAGIDAALDEAINLFGSVDNTTLDVNVQQGINLVKAADASVDSLLEVLGVPDPDDETSATSAENGLPTGSVRNTTKENQVEIEEIAKKVDLLASAVEALAGIVKPLAESVTAAEETEETPVEIDFALIAEACVKAGLPEAARKVVYSQVRLGGIDPETAIAEQKALVDSIEAQVSESLGAARVRVGTDSPNQDFTLHNSKWAVTR